MKTIDKHGNIRYRTQWASRRASASPDLVFPQGDYEWWYARVFAPGYITPFGGTGQRGSIRSIVRASR